MLDELELKLLELVIFEEHFNTLVEEMACPKPIVADTVKKLLVKEMLHSVTENPDTGKAERTYSCDGDNLHLYRFVATKKGLIAAGMM